MTKLGRIFDITKFCIKITWISNIWRISYSIAVCICCLFQGIKLQKTGIKLEREAEREKRECIRTDTLSLWHKILKDCLFHFCLNPLVGIDKCFYPWGYLIAVFTIGRITTVLPREDRTFQVRHDSQVTAVCTS